MNKTYALAVIAIVAVSKDGYWGQENLPSRVLGILKLSHLIEEKDIWC